MKYKIKIAIISLLTLVFAFGNITSVYATESLVENVQHVLPIIDIANYAPMADGNITYEELVKEVQADKAYADLDFKRWDLLITQKGINHIDDKLLEEFAQKVPKDLTEAYTRLQEAYDKNPTPSQITQINTLQAKYEAQKVPLTADLQVTKTILKENKAIQYSAESLAIIQEKANAVAAIDGKIDSLIQPLRIPDDIKECERFILSVKEKFACAIKEQELRKAELVKREYAHTTYYMDFTPVTHSHITGVVDFVNADATVTGSGAANFDADGDNILAGDYIRQSDGTEWYKVLSITDSTHLELTINFQQVSHTDDVGASFWCKSATNNGLAINDAFPHLNRYTTDTTRTAGDILKVRANQTHVVAGINITFDEAGTVIAYNEIRGCSVADDPFSDSSNVQPIFDFGNTAFYLYIASGKNYWRLFNFAATNTNSTYGILTNGGGSASGLVIDSCTVYGNQSATGTGIYVSGAGVQILNTTVYSNKANNIYASGSGSSILLSNVVVNGGVATTDYGVVVQGRVEIINSSFGVTTSHDIACIRETAGGVNSVLRNSILSGTETSVNDISSCITSEEHDQTLGAHSAFYYSGTITKCAAGLTDTTVRAGGGLSSALMLPSSVVTIKYPLNLAYGSLNPDFAIWCPASATTVTVYMRAYTIWATYPTASQLFIQADYYAGATALRSQSTASTQTLTDNREPAGAGTYTADAGTNTTTVVDAGLVGSAYIGKYLYNATRSNGAEITNYNDGTKTITLGTAITSQTTGDTYYILDWVAFTTTFTPGTAGFAYVKVNLGLYAASKGVRVDAKPLASY